MTTTNMTTANKIGVPSVSRLCSNTVALFLGGVLCGSLVTVTTPVKADEPNMQSALSSLQAAKRSLQNATPNKGGHRERAIQLTQQAIYETEAGIRYSGRN